MASQSRKSPGALLLGGLVFLLCGALALALAADEPNVQPTAPTEAEAELGDPEAASDAESFDDLIAKATEAIRLDPGATMAYNNRGVAYGEKSKYDRAIADFDAVLRLDPTHKEARRNREEASALKSD